MQARKFKYLPHTADIKFVAYGRDFKESIENAALALLNIMLDVKKIKKAKSGGSRTKIIEKADTQENLVWYTLQDILTKVDEKDLCAFEFRVKSLEQKGGSISLKGELLYKESIRGCFLTEVKAVTPYGLTVKKTGRAYEITVVVDV